MSFFFRLSPELNLKRPAKSNDGYRLMDLLKERAMNGVRIYVIMYKELEMALSINSYYSKQVLQSLHESNVRVNTMTFYNTLYVLSSLTHVYSHFRAVSFSYSQFTSSLFSMQFINNVFIFQGTPTSGSSPWLRNFPLGTS